MIVRKACRTARRPVPPFLKKTGRAEVYLAVTSVIYPSPGHVQSERQATFVSPVFQDEHHYYSAYHDDLCCFEIATGKQLWKAKGVSAGHGNAMFQMTPNGQRVFILDEDGKLILARLAPEGYTEIARTALLEPTTGAWTPASGHPKIWAQPAYANGHIFARSDKEVVCASLKAIP